MEKGSVYRPYSSSNSILFETDDSSDEESQNLLSQFVGYSAQEAQEPPRYTHDGKQNNRPAPPPTSVTQPSGRKQSPLSSGHKFSPSGSLQERLHMPQKRVELRHQRGMSSGSDHSRVKDERNTVILPTFKRKERTNAASPAPGQRYPSPNGGPAGDSPGGGRTRRSRRARNEPLNYYAKMPLHLSESEDEFETKSRTPSIEVQIKQSRAYPSPRRTVDPSEQINQRPPASLGKMLRQRELGINVGRQIRANIGTDFKLSKSWKGASNDVIVLTWSPDGTKFAAGATAQCDEHNMEYNRGNNLILGDLTNNSLDELPGHWIPRYSRRMSASRVVNDTRLYMSVTAVQWFGDKLYTASYDNTVKIWQFPKNKPTCCKTLKHSSKVEVMARSPFEEDILATGTDSIGLWKVRGSDYIRLKMPRQRAKRDFEFVSTSLAWGVHGATKNILLAGMSEKDDAAVPQNGLLAGWSMAEAEAIPIDFFPNSQNIFDIKWHPTQSTFASASSAVRPAPGDTKTEVNFFDPLRTITRTMVFECPALDMNDITFCPMNPDYVTASCTDGITYVWDQRNPGKVLHRLQHGEPLNQLDETLPKEQADVGVRVALWGDDMDQFYTGSSDGVLKRWDILRAPEDVLMRDVATFTEEIMSGAFSPDKSNILVGDAAGGIHILSAAPFINDDHLSLNFRRCDKGEESSNAESGVRAAQELLSSGQLTRHPVFGALQGPNYKGPYGAWARPKGTPPDRIAQTGLTEEWQLQQLGGIPPKNRTRLNYKLRKEVERHIQLAYIRNRRQDERKRKQTQHTESKKVAFSGGKFVDLCSDDDDDDDDDDLERATFFDHTLKGKRRGLGMFSGRIITRVEAEVIDLTGDGDQERSATRVAPMMMNLEREHNDLSDDFWWPENHLIDPNFSD